MSIAYRERVTSKDPQETTGVIAGGGFLYKLDPARPPVPAGWIFHEVACVATDSQDRGCVFNRGEHPVKEQDEILGMVIEGGLAAAGTAGCSGFIRQPCQDCWHVRLSRYRGSLGAPNEFNRAPPPIPEVTQSDESCIVEAALGPALAVWAEASTETGHLGPVFSGV